MARRRKVVGDLEAAAVRLLAMPGATNESVGSALGVSRETIRLPANGVRG